MDVRDQEPKLGPFDKVPEPLRSLRQWVNWKLEARDGRMTKVPVQASNPCRNASSTDPSTWSTFEEALACLKRHPKVVSGIGFVLTVGDPFSGIDIDGCIGDDGSMEPEVQELVRSLDSYTERSPSGQGLRSILRAAFKNPKTGTPGGRTRFPGAKGIEIYFSERFLTITGDHLEGTPTTIGNRQKQLDELVASLWPRAGESSDPSRLPAAHAGAGIALTDDEIIDSARAARNGAKFAALFDQGDISLYADDWSRADSALCAMLAFWTGPDPDRIEHLFNRSRLVRPKWTDRADYRHRTIEGAIQKVTESATERATADGAKGSASKSRRERAVIRVGTDMESVVNQAEVALKIHAEGLIYQRAEALVHVVQGMRDVPGSLIRREPSAPRVVLAEQEHVRELLSRSAVFLVPRGGQGSSSRQVKPGLPPVWVGRTLSARRQWTLQHLEGIVEAPFLRPDGTVATRAGYDPGTGLLMLPQPGLILEPIPDEPKEEDVARAIQQLRDPLVDFKFISDSDRSVVLAAILTGLGRPAIIGPTPLFGLGAPIRGAGKTLLANLITHIVTGHMAAAFSPPADADSLRKVLLALAIAGDPVVLMDNIEGAFGSAPLAMALTTQEISDRILGVTRFVRASLKPLWLATGNGLTFVGDLARRVVPCDQDPEMENPEDRVGFTYANLLAHVRQVRGQLVAAGLTLLRAHAVAGRKSHGRSRMGSFEAWDDVVRSALLWAGEPDPLGSRERLRAHADADLALLRELHEAWWIAFNVVGGTVAQAIRKAETPRKAEGERKSEDGWEAEDGKDDAALLLRNALSQLDPKGGGRTFNPQTIGNRIAALAKRIVSGRRFERAGESGGSTRWRVVTVGQQSSVDAHKEERT